MTKGMTTGVDSLGEFGSADIEILSKERVYQRFFAIDKITLRHKLFAGGWSKPITRELFVRGDAVAAVIYDPALGRVGLVEQFRIGATGQACGPWCAEVVAGMFEPGETAEAVILRELEEEAGFTPTRLIPITSYYSSPGGSDEQVHLYCALGDLSQAGGIYGVADESEDIRFSVFDVEQVFDAMLTGKFNNAATLIALQWLQVNRSSLASKDAT